MTQRRTDESIPEAGYLVRRHSRLYWVFDVLAKLVTAGAFIYAAFVAGQFESKMSGTTILAQREQAESQLRASMFHDLIDPIVGPLKGGEKVPLDRERLLVELLVLNFHEHVEFKSLLEDIYKRLALDQSLGGEDAEIQRARLRSVARRVIDRQISILCVELEKCGEKDYDYEPAQLYFKNSIGTNIQECYWTRETDDLPLNGASTPASLNEKVCVQSPDNEYLVVVSVSNIDIQNRICSVAITIENLKTDKKYKIVRVFQFNLTEFDFPFTDNTRIDKDHRFSLLVDNFLGIDFLPEEEITVGLRLVWFPKDFITSRERPLNYGEIRKLLNVE